MTGMDSTTYIPKALKAFFCFALGVYLYSMIDESFAFLFLISLGLVSAVKRAAGIKSDVFLCVSLILLGIILTQNRVNPYMQTSNNYIGHYTWVRGRICEIPVHKGDIYKYVIETESISMKGKEDKCREKMIVYIPDYYELGETLEYKGILKNLPSKMNDEGFDYQLYYRSRGIYSKMTAKEYSVSPVKIKSYSLYSLAMNIRYKAYKLTDKMYDGDEGAVLKAVVTGFKGDFSQDYKDMLLKNGLIRFYYPAYLHLLIIIYLFSLIKTHIKRKYTDILMTAVFMGYAVINSSNPIFLKVFILSAFGILAVRIWGYLNKGEALFTVVLGIGILNPLLLFDAGLIMSVCGSLAVLMFFDRVYRRLFFIKYTVLRSMIACNIICSVVLIPILAKLFNSMGIYSFLAAPVMAVSAAVILAVFPIAALITNLTGTAPIFGNILSGAVYAMWKLPILINRLPFSHINLSSASTLTLMVYVMLVSGIWLCGKKLMEYAKIIFIASVGFIISLSWIMIDERNDINVSFVNVGQGDGAVIHMPFCGNILIDGGGGNNYSDYNPGKSLYLPYLFDHDIMRAELAVVSHYHKDHVEGIIAAMENITVKELFMPGVMPDNEYRIKLEEVAERKNIKITYVNSDMKCNFANGAILHIYAPNEIVRLSKDENDTSLIAQLEYGNTVFTFTGDITGYAEKYSADRLLDTDVLKTAHHGSGNSTSKYFVDTVKPEYAVISLGEDNSYGFPDKSVLENLKNCEILRTDEMGDITFRADKNGIKEIRTLN